MKAYLNSPSLQALQKELLSGGSFFFEGLWEPTKALLAHLIVQTTKTSVLLITGGTREDRLFTDLAYFDPKIAVEFPSWETLPGEEIAPSVDILGKRFEALHTLLTKSTPSVVLCPLQALMQKVLPPKALKPLLSEWKVKMKIPFHSIPSLLVDLGYVRQAVVSDKGQFAIRGGILDLFPASSSDPYRVDFFDDSIESIRIFDPVGQKSITKVDGFFLSPTVELPLLQKETSLVSIGDYLKTPWVLWDDLLSLEEIAIAFQKIPGSHSRFFYSFDEVLKQFQSHLFCSTHPLEELTEHTKSKTKTKYTQEIAFEMFNHTFEAKRFFLPFQKIETPDTLNPDESFLFLYKTDSEKKEMGKQIESLSLPNTKWEEGEITSGVSILDLGLNILPYSIFSGKAPIRRQKWRSTHHTPASDFHALALGDLVVHYHSGIGKYRGMEKQKNHLGVETEFLILEYANESKLFVPLSQAYLVSRYIGTKEESPHLSELGTKRWQKVRDQASTQIVGYAHDLLKRQAERIVEGGFRYAPDSDLMIRFEKDFPYIETEDQLLAIEEIKKDMMSDKPMDRLICGDVGYGKTEVAMRAAFKAVLDGGKQVAVLVPTTVLAMQHYETFSQRMRNFPVVIDVVSRFRTAKESKETVAKTKEGHVDILIGTHRILSQDVKFKDLGLIIIDEEQRFGVRSKEHLKKFKAGVDCLTMSATPIPRTLHLSLIHAKDMSTINTPPQDRLPIKTIIAESDPTLIQNALLREFARNGQAFFIHNRVESIFSKAAEIQKIVPSARIVVAHGQMDPDEIDMAFHKFKQGEADLLIATTIIENGIDIPNGNTILIDRADTYGLADLYQLRGRVGRWNRAAYTYFLIPKQTKMTEPARKRLHALAESGGYGGGMKIAMRDLEIRGAGDILGVQQSGEVSSIGFHLYCKLLKRAIDSLKKNRPISFFETKMEFAFDAYFPDAYINDVSLRMELYHRLGEASSGEDIDALLEELKDRFGEPPLPVIWLYHLSKIRVFAAAHQFTLIKFGTLSFLAEKQKGKEIKQHTVLLPKKMQEPALLEKYVIEELKKL